MKNFCVLFFCVSMVFGCKTSSVNTKSAPSIFIQIDTSNTVIINGYLMIEAEIVNHSNDTILLLKPKSTFNEKIDYFSIQLKQGDTEGCGIETFELQAPKNPSYRFSNDFLTIAPQQKKKVSFNGRFYDLLIYCQDKRAIALKINYHAVRYDGKNSAHILNQYVATDKKPILATSVKNFSKLYEGKIQSETISFIPKQE